MNYFRFSSTKASESRTTFLPSVSWLIHKNKLAPNVVSSIVGSGPRNRLLKGDILAFLNRNPSHIQKVAILAENRNDLISNQEYHYVDIDTSNLDESVNDLGQMISLASIMAIKETKVPLLNSTVFLSKESAHGTFLFSIDTQAQAGKLSLERIKSLVYSNTLKPQEQLVGALRIVDTLSSNSNSTRDHDIINGEIGVLTISKSPSINRQQDLIDILSSETVQSERVRKSTESESKQEDILDFLIKGPKRPSHVRLDFSVDGRIISSKLARRYFEKIKDLLLNF